MTDYEKVSRPATNWWKEQKRKGGEKLEGVSRTKLVAMLSLTETKLERMTQLVKDNCGDCKKRKELGIE